MLNEPQIGKLLGKIERFSALIEPMIFNKHDEVSFSAYLTKERLHNIPDDSCFEPVEKGYVWYG